MPRTLDETYDRVIYTFDDQYFEEVRTALCWLAFSARPITVAELAEACSIRIGHNAEPSLEDGGYEAIAGLLDVISPFVLLGEPREVAHREEPWPHKYVEASTRPVRLAHFSVKEYLISSRLKDRESRISKYRLVKSYADRTLSQMCCAYFLVFTNHHGIRTWIEEKKALECECSEYGVRIYRNDLEDFAPSFPLLSYACDYWHKHQKLSELWSESLPEYERLHLHILENEQIRVAWLRLEDGGGARFMSRFDGDNKKVVWHDGTQALYWAALLGLRGTVKLLCDRKPNPDVNHVAGKYGFPLQAAASAGDSGVVNFLIGRGADPKLEGGYYGTALRAAVCAGDRDVVSKLLQADPGCARSANGGYGSALQAAVEGGDEQIVKSLLQAGADPNCPVKERFGGK